MKITLFVPCWNEEKSIRRSIESWLAQTRPADQIIVVDDSSTDGTVAILQEFSDRITVVRTPSNLGNKSHAQEYGLQFVTGDVFLCTDADTLLEPDFIEQMEKSFQDPQVAAVGGYIRSLKQNWLTRHRAFEYVIGQNFHKLAQSYLGCMFVIPGAAGGFRTDIFRHHLTFDHDTIAEDLDFTYKLHRQGFKIVYNRDAIVNTQDPATLSSYINQMRRWTGGGWQNLMKNFDIARHPIRALELSMMYIEGFIFSILLMLIPLINIRLAILLFIPYFLLAFVLSVLAAKKEKRGDLVFASFTYVFFLYLNSYLFLEQFFQEVVMRKRHLTWFTPERTLDL